ncbi:membrane protein [Arthrobacter phage Lewando]|nr:membrane protein [Arthrobacter phage Lewando]
MDPFASTPDYIAPELAFPLMAIAWAIWFVLGSEQRREARKARKAINQ